MKGYCTADDVRKVLQETSLDDVGSGPLTQDMVEAGITAQTDWIRRETGRHWYDPATTDDLIPSNARTITEDNYDLPQSPHAGPRQVPRAEDLKFPVTEAGGYAKVTLKHQFVSGIQTLRVRNGRDFEDWTADPSRTEGRGEDYYVETTPRTGTSYLYVLARSLSPSQDWRNSVVVDYEYGETPIPGAIRQAQACFAGADLVMDDDVKTSIPNDGQLVSIETKADRLINQGQRLLEPYK